MRNIFPTLLAALLGFVFAIDPALASDDPIWCVSIMPGCGSGGGNDYEDNLIFSRIVPNFITWIIQIAVAGGVVVAIIGGGMIGMAGSDDEMKSKGLKTFFLAGVGLVIAFLAYLIVELVNRLPFPNVG